MTNSVRIAVRSYELDSLGHLNQAVYHQYAEVARIEVMEAAGGLHGAFLAARIAPVLLRSEIVFRSELHKSDVVDVTCDTEFGAGKTFRQHQKVVKLDGTVSAEIECLLGLMDLDRRKLVDDPRAALRANGVDLARLTGGAES